MASPSTSNYAPPRSEDEFEDMVIDALRIRTASRSIVRFGRSGQAQHGIDGFDPAAPPGKTIVVQSTLTRPQDVLAKIKADLAKYDAQDVVVAERFYFALGIPRDAKVQAELYLLAAERIGNNLCPVEPLFWEDIRDLLVAEPTMFAKHFSAYGTDPELARLQREQLQFDRTPQVDLLWRDGSATGEKGEQRRLVVRNVGPSNVRVVEARLLWRILGEDTPHVRVLDPRPSLLMQGEDAAAMARIDTREVLAAAKALGIASAKIIQEVPLKAWVELTLVSEPAGVRRTARREFERIVNRPSPAVVEALSLRADILRECYRLHMEGSPGARFAWRATTREQVAWLRTLIREASWLAQRGLIDAYPAPDSTILEARLTPSGRDHVERHAEDYGVASSSQQGFSDDDT